MNLPVGLAWFEDLTHWVWTTSWQATALVALVLMISFLGRRHLSPRWHYILWMLVLVRLCLPGLPSSPWSLFNAPRLLPRYAAWVQTSGSSLPDDPAYGLEGGTDTAWNPPGEPPSDWKRLLGICWVLGLVSYGILVLGRHHILRRRLQRSGPVRDRSLQRLLRDCQRQSRMNRPVRLFELPDLSSPAVFGFWRPVLLLPTGLAGRLSVQELRGVLLHELTHLKRADPLVNWLMIALQSIHWWNPFIWLAFKKLRSDRELVRDGDVLKGMGEEERRAYGDALIRVAADLGPASISPVLVPVISPKSALKRRIVLIAGPRLGAQPAAILPVALVIGFTFTAASRPSPATSDISGPPAPSLPTPGTPPTNPHVEGWEAEAALIRARIRDKQLEWDAVADRSGPGRETGPPVETVFLEKRSAHNQLNSLCLTLNQLGRAELRQALPSVVEDPLLEKLLMAQARTEQTLSWKRTRFSPSHPEVLALNQALALQEEQIEERLDGVLSGLNAKLAASQAAVDVLSREMEQAAARESEQDRQRRIREPINRELQTLQTALERLEARLEQAGIDAAVFAPHPSPNLQPSTHEK